MKTSIKLNSASCLISNQSKQRLSLQFCFLGHFSLFLFLFQIFQNVTVCMCVCVCECVCVCVCVYVYNITFAFLRSSHWLHVARFGTFSHSWGFCVTVPPLCSFIIVIISSDFLSSLSFFFSLSHTHTYIHTQSSAHHKTFWEGGSQFCPCRHLFGKIEISCLFSLFWFHSISTPLFL